MKDLDKAARARATASAFSASEPQPGGPAADPAAATDSWAALPVELVVETFARLSPEDVLRAGASCRAWRAAAGRAELTQRLLPPAVARGASGYRALLEDVRTRGNLAKGRCAPRPLEGSLCHATALAASADGLRLAAGCDGGEVRVWDLASGTLTNVFAGHARKVGSVAFAGDGRLLASASLDGSVRLWDVVADAAVGSIERCTDWAYCVCFAPDQKDLAVSNENAVALWDARSLALTRSYGSHSRGVTGAAFSPDGATLASCGMNFKVLLHDIASGALLREFFPLPRAEVGYALSFSSDAQRLALAGGKDGASVWDLADDTQPPALALADAVPIHSVAFAADGPTLVGAAGQRVVRWDAATGAQVQQLADFGDMVHVESVALGGRAALAVLSCLMVPSRGIQRRLHHYSFAAQLPPEWPTGEPGVRPTQGPAPVP